MPKWLILHYFSIFGKWDKLSGLGSDFLVKYPSLLKMLQGEKHGAAVLSLKYPVRTYGVLTKSLWSEKGVGGLVYVSYRMWLGSVSISNQRWGEILLRKWKHKKYNIWISHDFRKWYAPNPLKHRALSITTEHQQYMQLIICTSDRASMFYWIIRVI